MSTITSETGLSSSINDSQGNSVIATPLNSPELSSSSKASVEKTKRKLTKKKTEVKQQSSTVTNRHRRNNKKYGTSKEREVIEQLTASGCSVTRAAGSLGLFDIVAIHEYGIRLIQVKSTRAKKVPTFGTEVKAIKAFTNHPPNTSKELWVCTGGSWTKRLI